MLCVLGIFSCQDKVICPAFQSTYILDDSTRNAYFSYVWQLDEPTRMQFLAQQDTTSTATLDSISPAGVGRPQTDYYAYAGEKVVPWRVSKRTKYGIVKPVFMPIKKYRMRTAPMENVLRPKPEPTAVDANFVVDARPDSIATDSLSLAATDTLSIESFAVEEEEKKETRFLYGYDPSDNFNVEQQYYNKYFSSRLIDNRPEPKPAPVIPDSTQSDSTSAKKSLFKGLFGGKKKTQASDSVATEPPVEEAPSEESGNE